MLPLQIADSLDCSPQILGKPESLGLGAKESFRSARRRPPRRDSSSWLDRKPRGLFRAFHPVPEPWRGRRRICVGWDLALSPFEMSFPPGQSSPARGCTADSVQAIPICGVIRFQMHRTLQPARSLSFGIIMGDGGANSKKESHRPVSNAATTIRPREMESDNRRIIGLTLPSQCRGCKKNKCS